MSLDERKIKILEAIISDYIKTAEPVGSRTIVKKYDMGISSATIRNEMADLEELGFIVQPHASAGRIPSDKGYRLYVDELLKSSKLSKSEKNQIDDLFKKTYKSFDIFLEELTSLVSHLTNYTVVASKPQSIKSNIKNIQLIAIDQNSVLLVTILNNNIVKNNMLRIEAEVTQEVLAAISKILNENLCGLTLRDINLELISQIKYELGAYNSILEPILDVISEMINEVDNLDYYATGINNILDFPEFTDVSVAKELIGIVEDKKRLTSLLETKHNLEDDDSNGENVNSAVSIRIGEENEYAQDCSVVTCKYQIDKESSGMISIIGPKRMNYDQTVAILKAIVFSMEHKKEE